MAHTYGVGASMMRASSGTSPSNPGGITMIRVPVFPIVRDPGTANTSVHMSSSGSM
ncbi:Uncharacterised protein [Mycobacteroides abscessus subsp. abscessus]|nr:Uncharacterised protein [Mycobacteroides abscessus subsp. abscessus]